MIEFYQAQTSTNSGKVRLVLEEKQIPYREIDISLEKAEHRSADYLKLNPNGVVPTIIHDGHVLIESSLINEYLNEVFDGPDLVPDDPLSKGCMRYWPLLVDIKLHPATWVITYTTLTRPAKSAAKSDEDLKSEFAAMKDLSRSQLMSSLQFDGVRSPSFAAALQTIRLSFRSLDQALGESGGPWILGDQYTLADVALSPWLMRFENIMYSGIWSDLDDLQAWWERIKDRPNFCGIVSKRLDPAILEKRTIRGREIWPEVKKLLGELQI
ncbi:MAG: glutathione S-transferase family protein [Methyloligellaceae bacterium]